MRPYHKLRWVKDQNENPDPQWQSHTQVVRYDTHLELQTSESKSASSFYHPQNSYQWEDFATAVYELDLCQWTIQLMSVSSSVLPERQD